MRALGWGLSPTNRPRRGKLSVRHDGSSVPGWLRRPAAFSIGHGNPEVNAAIASQLAQVACGYRYLFSSEPLEELTHLLLTKCGADFEPIVYSSSGSEAVESAMKVALQYWDARGQRAKRRFIARQRSYHSNTLDALPLSGFLERMSPFEGSLLDVELVSAASDYRPLNGLRGAALTDAEDDIDHSVRHGRLPVRRRRSVEQPTIAVLAVSIDPFGRACARDTHLGCDVRDRPSVTSFYQASTSLQRQRCVAVHRLRYQLCRRSFWNQWCAYGSLLKGSTSTNPAPL
jgi:hypothetical protein